MDVSKLKAGLIKWLGPPPVAREPARRSRAPQRDQPPTLSRPQKKMPLRADVSSENSALSRDKALKKGKKQNRRDRGNNNNNNERRRRKGRARRRRRTAHHNKEEEDKARRTTIPLVPCRKKIK